jgi:predicted NUDIX family phosphoesterase
MEQVLVVPRFKLFPQGAFQGFLKESMDEVLCLIKEHAFFGEREKAEHDPSHKQIIPYVVLTSGKKVFAVKRLKAQGEKRLHEKVSIGLGGHINPEDAVSGKTPWESALERELSEEVFFEKKKEAELIGILNDDETPVGRVHFGLVYQLEVLEEKTKIKEMDKMEGKFCFPFEIVSDYPRMESWSQFVFASLWPDIVPQVV